MKRAGRLHAPEVDALVARPASPASAQGDAATLIELRAPMPGVFVPWIAQGDLVTAGGAIGAIVVLGKATALLAPRTAGPTAATGIAVRITATGVRAVGYGDTLVTLDPTLSVSPGAGPSPGDPAAPGAAVAGLVFRAPTSGRFYGRSSPDKPAFVSAGTALTQGATICLLEVMKTFHRVTYGGPGLPDTAQVRSVLVADGDDVSAGDPLLALE
jgi:acetyl-CoA carboxylase biotin carboxyl carrier protein